LPHAIDEAPFAAHHSAMAHAEFFIQRGFPAVVGSFGSPDDLANCTGADLLSACDLAEIRLDLFLAPGNTSMWRTLREKPLLFTARRPEEGGAGNLQASERASMLRDVLDDAALIDIEVASIVEMRELLDEMENRGVPWIASFHDFEKLPETSVLEAAVKRATDAGAAAFKVAARLQSPADLARLAEFQLADHAIPVATMGMGPLAPVSRMLCAQCGSVLNYGYLGTTPTAPGQWDAGLLKLAVSRLAAFGGEG
jgi:3-dehydroquinate dehydratase-1